MSESIDNFKTLGQAVQVYTAHAMRLALVDAGDGMEDANFVHDTADKGILRLTKEPLWYDEVLAAELRSGEASSFADKVFDKCQGRLQSSMWASWHAQRSGALIHQGANTAAGTYLPTHAPQPNTALQGAAMYMQERIEALRRDHGNAKVVHADLFVSDRFTGWRERVFINLSQLYSQQTRGFPADVSQQMVARESP
ncbi:hypothetical protein WJX77_004539 [Trebouxia sp. C0004]